MKSQKEVIEFLRGFWKVKSFDFEAQFNINPNSGKGNFWDIKNPNTKEILLHPENQSPLKVGAPPEGDFEIGKYYNIRIFVPNDGVREKFGNDYVFFLDVKNRPPEEIKLTPIEFIQQINTEYSSAIGIAKETLAGAVKRISYDISRKPETFIFELLQNADDYPDPAKNKVNVRFVITDNFLIVSHNGLPFSPANVRAICSVDAGNKQFDMNKTGYKGIGFKSIFKFSNYVVVNSGGFTFRFDEFYHKKKGTDTFWQLIPNWTEKDELPPIYNHPQFTDPNVSFCIRPKIGSVDIEDIQAVFKDIFRDERVLLFLRHVTSIDFSGINGEAFTHSVSKSKWEVSDLLEIKVSESIREIVNKQIKDGDGRVPDKFQDIQFSSIRFATVFSEGKIFPSKDTRVFAYLPTDVNLGFPFLINGDFIPDGSRHLIHMDLKWNGYLFEEAGKQFVYWLQILSAKYNSPEFLILIPDFGTLIETTLEKDKKLILEQFKSGFEHTLSEVAFLPDLDGNLQKIEDLTVDSSNLLSLLGEDNFRKYLFIEGPILAPTFANSPDINILLESYEFGELLTHDAISSLLENEDFTEYLLDSDQNFSFISFLNDQGVINDYSDQSIFLSFDGNLKSGDEVYFSLGEDATLLDWLDIPVLNEKLNQLEFLKTTVKTYSPIAFIKDEILDSETAKTNTKVFKNNQKLFQLLFKHHEILPEKDFFDETQFRIFPVFDRNKGLISNFNNSSFFLTNKEINELIDSHAIPVSLVKIINPKNYFQDEVSTRDFWAKLGVAEWSEESALPLAKTIFSNSLVIHTHFTENLEYVNGSKRLWQFIFKTLSKESGENQKSYRENASKLPVLTTEEEVKALQDCYLSAEYTGNNSLETLHENHPEIEINFVSDNYIKDDKVSDCSRIFRTFGVKTESKDFIAEYILPEIENIPEDDLISYTQLIFLNRNYFTKEISELSIKIKTMSGVLIEAKDAIIGVHYSIESKDAEVLSSITLENLISEEYSNQSLPQWSEFFESLGAKILKTKEEAIQEKLDELTFYQGEEETWQDHQVLINDLIGLYNSKQLTKEHYSSLQYLSLITKDTDKKSVACTLFFSSEYNPKVDFEKMINSESVKSRFISPNYLKFNKEVKSLLIQIGVFDNFKIEKRNKVKREKINLTYLNYLELKFPIIKQNANQYASLHSIESYVKLDLDEFIEMYEFNKGFWKTFSIRQDFQNSVLTKIKYNCSNSFFNVESLILWQIQNQNSIPCQDGESRKPSEIYTYKLNELLNDKALLPLIDLSDLLYQGQSVEKLLGFKTDLDLKACLSIFEEQPSVTSLRKTNVWQTLIKILENSFSTREEVLAFQRFREEGFLPNQLGEWKLISELHFIDESIDIGITKAPNLIHDDLRRIAEKFNITALTSKDFKPQFKNLASEGFKDLFLSRLKFIALIESPERLEDKKAEFQAILAPLSFYKANKIELACHKTEPAIVNSEKQFLILESAIYYLRSWHSPYSDELFKFVKKLLDLKKVSEKTLKDILIWSELELFELFDEKNIEYPSEWNPLPKSSDEDILEDENEFKEDSINDPKQSNQSSNSDDGNTFSEKSTSSQSQGNKGRESELSIAEKMELESLLGRSISPEEMSDSWFNAFIRAIHYYENHDFDLSNIKSNLENSIRKRMMQNIQNKRTGESKTILVRSANSGMLRLKYNAWFDLNINNTELFVTTGNGIGEFIIYKDPNELANGSDDSLVMKLDGVDKYVEIESLLQGEYSSEEKKYSSFELFFRVPGNNYHQSIFESIYNKESKRKVITGLD